MTKFKKIVSGTLAGCLMASALMMSAGAANVQTYIPSGTVQAAAQNTAQTRTAVKINPQSADIYAEGIPAAFPSEDGKTVYTMQLTFLATEHPVGDAEWETLRAQILSGDETGLLESHIDTYRFRFSGGEPYFLEHNELMICR